MIYVGGSFTTVGGISGFKYLARYSAATGAVDTTWKPQLGWVPRNLVFHKGTNAIFVATNAHCTKWSTTSGTQQTFLTFTGGTTSDGLVLDGDTLYVGGDFTSVGGLTRNRLVKIDVTGNSGQGTVDSSFAPNVNGYVYTIAIDDNHVYFGGVFTTVNGSASRQICKVKKTDGTFASDWSVATRFVNGTVRVISILSDNNLYVGGSYLQTYAGTSISNSFVKLSKSGSIISFSMPAGLVDPANSSSYWSSILEIDNQLYLARSRTDVSAPVNFLKGSNNLTSLVLDSAFTGTVAGISGGTSQQVFYSNGLNLFVGLTADSGTYNGGAVNHQHAISKATGAVVELQADTTAPTVTLSSSVANAGSTSQSPVSMTATFSETVTGFTVGDITVTGGSASNFTGSGSSYTFSVTPSGQGSISVSIGSGVCQDLFGNSNTASSSYSFTYDSVQPTVSLSSTTSSGSAVNSSPVLVTATFSEAVTGFVAGDVTAFNATISGFSGSGTTYSFSVTPSGQGAVSVSIGSGVCQDAAGNMNQASAPFQFTYDTIQPSVTISSLVSSGGFVSAGPVSMTATFSEPVTGFTSQDLSLGNCSLSNFSGSGTTYTFDLLPANDGEVTVLIPAGVCQDSAGNTNTASGSYSFTMDSLAPSVVLSSLTVLNGGSVSTGPVSMAATFSEAVTGFTSEDITVTNGSVSSFSGSGGSYLFSVAPSSEGLVSVLIGSGVCQDSAGNNNAASSTFSFTFDSVAPTVTISAVNAETGAAVLSGSVIAQIALVITASFSEAVTGVLAGDFSVSGGAVSSFTDLGGGQYSIRLTPSQDGQMSISLPAGAAQDLAGNNSGASGTLTFTVETPSQDAPVATMAQGSVAARAPLPVTLNKAAVATSSGVAQNLWRRVLLVYTAAGKPKVAMSFKPSQASPMARFRAGSAAAYQLSEMIVVKTDGSFARILRAGLAAASQYDITVT